MLPLPGSAPVPNWDALFPACDCAENTCRYCSGWQLSPRTALVLHGVAAMLSDYAYDDIEALGDAPLDGRYNYRVIDQYPMSTWTQSAVWRRQAARCFDDLAADLAAGLAPRPRCRGEEMALHLILAEAPEAIADEWGGITPFMDALDQHHDDCDFEAAREALLPDEDILLLFDRALDGIDDPENAINQFAGMGDLRPSAWFNTFPSALTRDGRRPFRR